MRSNKTDKSLEDSRRSHRYRKLTEDELKSKFEIGSIVRIFNGGTGRIIGYTSGPLEINGVNQGLIIITNSGMLIKRLHFEVKKM